MSFHEPSALSKTNEIMELIWQNGCFFPFTSFNSFIANESTGFSIRGTSFKKELHVKVKLFN